LEYLFTSTTYDVYKSSNIAEHGDVIYINLTTKLGVAVLQAVKTEANMLISI
jgi:hypothetical protein